MKTLIKDILREIRSSAERFISIILIIALGVGFFAGIKATSKDMKDTANNYFKKYDLMDFHVVSTMGFDDDDVEEFKKIKNIETVTNGYSLDVLTKFKDRDIVTKVKSIPDQYYDNLNKLVLVKGEMPKSEDECLLEYTDSIEQEYSLGSKIKIESGNEDELLDNLKKDEYKVVGLVKSPMHITYERGTSKIGNGKVNNFMLIPESQFKLEYYTDIYLGIDKNLHFFSNEYKDYLKDIEKDIEILGRKRQEARRDDIYSKLEEKLIDGEKELELEKNENQKKLDEAKSEIDFNKSKIISGEGLYKDGVIKLEKEIKKGYKNLDKKEEDLEKARKDYDIALNEFNKEKPKIEEKIKNGENNLTFAESELKELNNEIILMEEKLNFIEDEDEKVILEENILNCKNKYEEGNKRLDQSRIEINKAKNKLTEGEKELSKAREDIAIGEFKISEGRKNLELEKINGEKKLDSERIRLDIGKKELDKANLEYEEGLSEFRKEVIKAERELNKLKREMKNLEKPDWYIIAQNNSRDYIEYEMGGDRIDSVSKVFPLFFFLIALLVCLTTMTRMVDEQRGYIGILKALGYSNLAIALKYLIYSFIASIVGSVLGLIIGFKVFPTVIFNAYRIMFIMPPIETSFNIYYGIISIVAAILTTSLATFLAVRKELTETASNLMRPKAPKIGKRIFLEKIDIIWSNLKFSQKVTARNIFRYKRRLYMTVIGIAGCTALILAGFGLKDSIMDITDNQFNKVFQYNISADINEGIINRKKDPIIKFLNNDKRVDSYLLGKEEMLEVGNDDKKYDVNLVVSEDKKNLDNFIRLRDRESKEKYKLDNNKVIITEKLSKLLDVGIDDEVNIYVDNKSYKVKIGNIVENYAFHYMYMSETLYGKIFYKTPDLNKVFVKVKEEEIDNEEELSKDILNIEDISSIELLTGMSDALNDTMGSLNYVVVVLIVTAGALAFIVLYNLTNINIGERIREIATIKVLGFYDKEVSRYVYRENNVLTILGIILGMVLGFLLHKFIIYTVEIDMIMFGQKAKKISYLYSAILTIVFSQMVNFVMYFKLKDIDMVESLKSID